MGRQAQTGLTARLQPGEGLQNPKRPAPYFRTHGQSSFQAPSHGLHARNEKSKTGWQARASKGVKG